MSSFGLILTFKQVLYFSSFLKRSPNFSHNRPLTTPNVGISFIVLGYDATAPSNRQLITAVIANIMTEMKPVISNLNHSAAE